MLLYIQLILFVHPCALQLTILSIFLCNMIYYQMLSLLKFLKISSSSPVTEEFQFLKVLVLSHFYESESILYQNWANIEQEIEFGILENFQDIIYIITL